MMYADNGAFLATRRRTAPAVRRAVAAKLAEERLPHAR